MLSQTLSPAVIGIFDSGVGGLSVLRAIRQQIPDAPAIYFADQEHVPYGLRTMDEVRDFSEAITCCLLNLGARLIVVACNTASAAGLHHLRQKFPAIPFVGMEPAVKPAAEQTHTGVVGVLATPATFQGALYASVVERFAQGVVILQHTCPGLVQQIELGELNTPKTRSILEAALLPMLQKGIDTVVLGCTHYPFVIPVIQDITGPNVRVIDPAPAIARQTRRLLIQHQLYPPETNSPSETAALTVLTSGEVAPLQTALPCLLGESAPVERMKWVNSDLVILKSSTANI